tara:strand:- start:178 stop:363 length:186 start_codon:yes stop_codon:yes gene_type:complete
MVKLIVAALHAYVAYVKLKHRIFVYEIEDEMDDLAIDGSPAAKLRIERVAKRLQRELKRTV